MAEVAIRERRIAAPGRRYTKLYKQLRDAKQTIQGCNLLLPALMHYRESENVGGFENVLTFAFKEFKKVGLEVEFENEFNFYGS